MTVKPRFTVCSVSRSFCGRLVLPGQLVFTWVDSTALALDSPCPVSSRQRPVRPFCSVYYAGLTLFLPPDTASSSTQQRPPDAPARAPNCSSMVNAASHGHASGTGPPARRSPLGSARAVQSSSNGRSNYYPSSSSSSTGAREGDGVAHVIFLLTPLMAPMNLCYMLTWIQAKPRVSMGLHLVS
jgi:hypothetical protein